MLNIATVLLVLFLMPAGAYTDTFSDSGNNFTNNLRLYAHTGFSKPYSPTTFMISGTSATIWEEVPVIYYSTAGTK